jgi:hypothetical protein
VTPEERARRPQASWRDLGRTAGSLVRALRSELPPLPDRERAWHGVDLASDAASVLESAHAHSAAVLRRRRPGAPLTVDVQLQRGG